MNILSILDTINYRFLQNLSDKNNQNNQYLGFLNTLYFPEYDCDIYGYHTTTKTKILLVL